MNRGATLAPKGHIKESQLPSMMDLVIWGESHTLSHLCAICHTFPFVCHMSHFPIRVPYVTLPHLFRLFTQLLALQDTSTNA